MAPRGVAVGSASAPLLTPSVCRQPPSASSVLHPARAHRPGPVFVWERHVTLVLLSFPGRDGTPEAASPPLAHPVVPAAPGLTAGEKETAPGGGVPGSGCFHVSLRPTPCGRGPRPVVPRRAARGRVGISVSTGRCRRSVLENSHPQMLLLPALLPVWTPLHHRLPVGLRRPRALSRTPCCRPHGTGRDSSSG